MTTSTRYAAFNGNMEVIKKFNRMVKGYVKPNGNVVIGTLEKLFLDYGEKCRIIDTRTKRVMRIEQVWFDGRYDYHTYYTN